MTHHECPYCKSDICDEIKAAMAKRDKKWAEAIDLYGEGDVAIKAAILDFMGKGRT